MKLIKKSETKLSIEKKKVQEHGVKNIHCDIRDITTMQYEKDG